MTDINIHMNDNASVALCVIAVCGLLWTADCSPNRYVNCNEVCKPNVVMSQDSITGHCECSVPSEEE
jgi:hypothetical protein